MTFINEVGDTLFTQAEMDEARGEAYTRGWSDGADNTKIGFVRRLRGLGRALDNLGETVSWGKKAHIVLLKALQELYSRFNELREDEEYEEGNEEGE